MIVSHIPLHQSLPYLPSEVLISSTGGIISFHPQHWSCGNCEVRENRKFCGEMGRGIVSVGVRKHTGIEKAQSARNRQSRDVIIAVATRNW